VRLSFSQRISLKFTLEPVSVIQSVWFSRYISTDTLIIIIIIIVVVIIDYFHLLENKLDTNSFHIVLLGDFNAPGFNWVRGSPLPGCHYYSKLKGDAIYNSACLLGLRQFAVATDNHNLLDLVFSNLPDLKPVPSYSD
jgi:hypothetical protein